MPPFARALRALDEVQHPAQLDRFDPAAVLAGARAELPAAAETLAELEGALDAVRGLLGEVDRFAQKAMRIRLTHSPDALPAQLRTLVQTTVLSYEHDLGLLRTRVGAAMARLDPTASGAVADRVVELAKAVLATRAVLREGVAELARSVAAAWQPVAERKIRDRSQADEERARWKRAGVDLAAVAARGDLVEAGTTAERLAKIATPDDPPEEERPDRFSLIEID